MGLASLVTIPIGMLCYAVEMRDYAEKYGRVVAAKNHMGATIVEYIGGIEVIKRSDAAPRPTPSSPMR